MKKRKTIAMYSSLIVIVLGIMFLIRFMMVTEYTNDLSQNFNYFFNAEKNLPKYSSTVKSKNEILSSEKKVYILYKVGCPYCNAAHPYIKYKIKNEEKKYKENIRYVNVASPAGKSLVKKYNITRAATILVVSSGISTGYVSFDSAISKNSKIIPNKQDVDKAFTIFNEIV